MPIRAERETIQISKLKRGNGKKRKKERSQRGREDVKREKARRVNAVSSMVDWDWDGVAQTLRAGTCLSKSSSNQS